MAALQVTLDALGAEHAAIKRKVLPGFESNQAIVADFELNAALLSAETAVRLHQLLARFVRFALPSARRLVVQVRTESCAQFLSIRRLSHALPP